MKGIVKTADSWTESTEYQAVQLLETYPGGNPEFTVGSSLNLNTRPFNCLKHIWEQPRAHCRKSTAGSSLQTPVCSSQTSQLTQPSHVKLQALSRDGCTVGLSLNTNISRCLQQPEHIFTTIPAGQGQRSKVTLAAVVLCLLEASNQVTSFTHLTTTHLLKQQRRLDKVMCTKYRIVELAKSSL